MYSETEYKSIKYVNKLEVAVKLPAVGIYFRNLGTTVFLVPYGRCSLYRMAWHGSNSPFPFTNDYQVKVIFHHYFSL